MTLAFFVDNVREYERSKQKECIGNTPEVVGLIEEKIRHLVSAPALIESSRKIS
jgi:hypothetical protein